MDKKISFIQNYIYKISSGLINITDEQSQDIIDIGRGKTPFANLHRWNGYKSEWELIRTVIIDNEDIGRALKIASTERPSECFYRFDVYNVDMELQTFIFTLNPDLF